MKVIFRADGNPVIGFGHLTRCLALAQMLINDFDILFISRDAPEEFVKELGSLNLGFNIINSEKEFLNILNGKEIVVLDHYGLDSSCQKQIKEKGSKLVCIDDIHDKEFFADLIINHAPNVKSSNYRSQFYTKYALGLDYVLLRPVFLKKAKLATENRSMETVFVCFGGSDVKNLTKNVVEVTKTDTRFKKIIVVLGGGYKFLEDLKAIVGRDQRFCIYQSVSAEKMAELILEAGLSIVPASGILQEVIALGTNIISGIYVENQRNIFENFKKLDAFENAENFSKDNIIEAINRSFHSKSGIGSKLIDGNSDERLLDLFNKLK